ncbi:hypothetical protein G9A89_020203 [Geosiphon pyriformis]|nr:hypothetical protein G9A89_020203 [Geosiphon pyriformis]
MDILRPPHAAAPVGLTTQEITGNVASPTFGWMFVVLFGIPARYDACGTPHSGTTANVGSTCNDASSRKLVEIFNNNESNQIVRSDGEEATNKIYTKNGQFIVEAIESVQKLPNGDNRFRVLDLRPPALVVKDNYCRGSNFLGERDMKIIKERAAIALSSSNHQNPLTPRLALDLGTQAVIHFPIALEELFEEETRTSIECAKNWKTADYDERMISEDSKAVDAEDEKVQYVLKTISEMFVSNILFLFCSFSVTLVTKPTTIDPYPGY